MKADVSCETSGCPKEHDIINTVTFPMKDENTFYEGYGHGSEDAKDFCPDCGRLGVLQEPDLDEEEIEKFIGIAKQLNGSDDIQFDDDATTSLCDDRKGVWVQGWIYVAVPPEEE